MPVAPSQTTSTSVTTTFTRVQTTDRLINQLQSNIANAVNPLLALGSFNPQWSRTFLAGNLIQKVSLTSGANSVVHNLGYSPTGWFITRIRSAATIYDTQDSNAQPTKTLTLNASANCTVDIFIF